jgi:hypothetical protein
MRNNAIGTMSIAAILNFKEGTGMTMKRMKRGFRKENLLLNIANLNPWKFAFLHQGEKVRDLVLFSIS